MLMLPALPLARALWMLCANWAKFACGAGALDVVGAVDAVDVPPPVGAPNWLCAIW